MKQEIKYYVTGFTAVIIFIYLLEVGEKELAYRVGDNLLLICAAVFGYNLKK